MIDLCRVSEDISFEQTRDTNLFVHNNINFHTSLGATLQDLIQSPFWVFGRRPAEEQLRGEPPVLDIDGLCGFFQSFGDSPEVVHAIDIPFNAIALVDRRVGLEAVRLGDGSSLVIRRLLVRLIVAVVAVDDVEEFANLALQVRRPGFSLVEVGF